MEAELFDGVRDGLLTVDEIAALSRLGQKVRAEYTALRRAFPDLSDADLGALLGEEEARVECAGVTTLAEYRALSRVGSSIPLGGRQKKRIFEWLFEEV